MINYLYSKEELPDGFIFPLSFINLVVNENIMNLEPWWFLCQFEQLAKQWHLEIRKQYPTRVLVPFAKISYSDDLACFDGADVSGDPKVYYVHTFASPGWEDRGNVKNFDSWLELAKEESIRYKAERTETEED